MRRPDVDLVRTDAGAILLDLTSRVQSLPFGAPMANAIRRACLELPLVEDADIELAEQQDGASQAGASQDGAAWTHRYNVGPGPEYLGTLKLKVTDPPAFGPVDGMLRDAVGLLGLSIAHRRTREWLENEVIQRGAQLEERRAVIQHHVAENARLAEIVRLSVNPTYIMDNDFRLVWMNQPFLDTFGVAWDDAIGRRPSSVLYDEGTVTDLVVNVRQALRERGTFAGEVVNRDTGGRERIFALRMDRFRSADGLHEGFVAIREDITERRRAERALAENEARFRDLTETASDWFWETDADHNMTALSGSWPKPPDPQHPVVGRRRWDFAAGDLTDAGWQQHFDDLDHHRPFRDFRYTIRWPGRELAHVSISGRPHFDTDGRFLGYRGTGRDVTEEVRARETVDRLIRALDAIEDLVALFDADERLVFANRVYKTLHPELDAVLVPGIKMAELLEQLAERGAIEDPVRAIPERLARFRNPQGPLDIRRFGRWFRAKDQKLGDGGTLLIATDITDHKEAELELRRAVVAAEEANAAKSSFLARMSHELRTPLNAILGLTETLMLMEARLSHGKRREYLGDVFEAGRILLSHIDDILNFTRLEADGFAVHPRPIDPRRAVADAVRLIRVVARSRSIRLEVDLARDLPDALADPRSVRQILVNLLGNAVKFSANGSTVRLAVVPEGAHLRLSVSDRGIGIPPDQLDRIFEPFHQVGDPSVAVRDGGTGLGLSIVKSLVERNAGTVAVVSEPGQGTTICVRLPLAEDGLPMPANEVEERDGEGGGR